MRLEIFNRWNVHTQETMCEVIMWTKNGEENVPYTLAAFSDKKMAEAFLSSRTCLYLIENNLKEPVDDLVQPKPSASSINAAVEKMLFRELFNRVREKNPSPQLDYLCKKTLVRLLYCLKMENITCIQELRNIKEYGRSSSLAGIPNFGKQCYVLLMTCLELSGVTISFKYIPGSWNKAYIDFKE